MQQIWINFHKTWPGKKTSEMKTGNKITNGRRKCEQELTSCWDGRPFGPNRHGPKSGGLLCPFPWGELGSNLTQCRLGRGLSPYQVASWSVQAYGHNTPTLQTDRQTGQRSHSTGRPITCNGRPTM